MTEARLVGGTYGGETRTDHPTPYNQVYGECYVQPEEVDEEDRQIFKYDPSMEGPLS